MDNIIDPILILTNGTKCLVCTEFLFKLKYFPGQIPIIAAVALGPNKGIGQMKNGLILGEWITKKVKSQTLLALMYWKILTQKMPDL